MIHDLHGLAETTDHVQKKTLTGAAAKALEERKEVFRDYENSKFIDRVRANYLLNHTSQTFDFVMDKKKQVLGLNRAKMTIWCVGLCHSPVVFDRAHREAAELLDKLVDESDPDTGFGQVQCSVLRRRGFSSRPN
jgi:inositol oxygenase